MGPRDSRVRGPVVALDRLDPPPLPQRPLRPRSGLEPLEPVMDVSKGKAINVDSPAPQFNMATVSDVDETSIDEVIFNLIEIRNVRRPHLPRLINPLKRNLSAVPPPDPSVPPKRGRGRPKIIRDVQIVPPRGSPLETPMSGSDLGGTSTPPQTTATVRPDEWVPVVRRRRGKSKASKGAPRSRRSLGGTVLVPVPSQSAPTQKKRRVPRTAAVTITGAGEGFSYASVLKKARESIPLADLGIERSRIRRTINGGRIIEIPGLDAAKKADELAARLRSVLGAEVVVARPSVKGEIRIIGLDDTVSADEVISVVADLGGCANVDIKIGAIRLMANGLGTVWVQCPLAAAI